MIALNLGSGQRPFGEGWINVDKIAHEGMPAPDLICDGASLLAEWKDRFDYVVLHHVLEHFGCGEGEALIKEAHRVLKPGGKLYVFVPDMKALAWEWAVKESISTQIYMTNLYGAYMGHEEDRHKWGYDKDHLYEFLYKSAQWKEIHPCGNPNLPGADIAWDWWILGAEATK